MMILAFLLSASTPATVPDAEARALGMRYARTTTLATLLPLMTAKETADLVAAHPGLNAAEQDRLRQIAKRQADEGTRKLLEAEGDAYATHLSKADLRILVAAGESAAAKRLRAVMPSIIKTTMESASGIDFKGETLAAFCKQTGKLCQ